MYNKNIQCDFRQDRHLIKKNNKEYEGAKKNLRFFSLLSYNTTRFDLASMLKYVSGIYKCELFAKTGNRLYGIL